MGGLGGSIPVIDMETYDSMKEMLEEAFDEVLNDFIEDSSSKVKLIRTKLSESDLDQLRDLSHQLKSSSGSFGIMVFSSACGVMEESIRNQDTSHLEEQVKQIESTLDEALSEIRNLG